MDEGDKGKSTLNHPLFLDSFSKKTLADVTLCVDAGRSPTLRGKADGGSNPAPQTACRLGGSVRMSGLKGVEADPPHRPAHMETGGSELSDPPGQPDLQGKSVDDQGWAGVVEPPPLPT